MEREQGLLFPLNRKCQTEVSNREQIAYKLMDEGLFQFT